MKSRIVIIGIVCCLLASLWTLADFRGREGRNLLGRNNTETAEHCGNADCAVDVLPPDLRLLPRRSTESLQPETGSTAELREVGVESEFRIRGSITIYEADDRLSELQSGRIHFSRLENRLKLGHFDVVFDDGAFELVLDARESSLGVEYLIIEGQYLGAIVTGFSTDADLHSQDFLRLEARLPARQTFHIRDAQTGADLAEAELYSSAPVFISGLAANESRLQVIDSGPSPLTVFERSSFFKWGGEFIKIFASAPGYMSKGFEGHEQEFNLERAGSLSLKFGPFQQDLDWRLEPEIHVSFGPQASRFFYRGQPPPHKSITIKHVDLTQGRVVIDRVPTGTAEIVLSRVSQEAIAHIEVEIIAGQNTEVDLTAIFATARLPLVRVFGSMKGDPTRLPKKNFEVLLIPQSGHRDGWERRTKSSFVFQDIDPVSGLMRFDFGSCAPGSYTIETLDDVFPIEIQPGQQTAIDLTLSIREDLWLRLVDESGRTLDATKGSIEIGPWGIARYNSARERFCIPGGIKEFIFRRKPKGDETIILDETVPIAIFDGRPEADFLVRATSRIEMVMTVAETPDSDDEFGDAGFGFGTWHLKVRDLERGSTTKLGGVLFKNGSCFVEVPGSGSFELQLSPETEHQNSSKQRVEAKSSETTRVVFRRQK